MKHFPSLMTFDFIAPVYDKLAQLVFGRALLTAQQAAWWQVPAGSDVLILGGGTGTLLPRFLRDKRPQRVLYLEASAAMLQRAQQTAANPSQVEFRYGTEASLEPTDQFDAILLPFVLDLYPNATLQAQLVPRLLAALRPNGALYISDFGQPRTWQQRAVMAAMLLFFRVVARIPVRHLPDWPAVLTRLGLVEQQSQTFRGGQLRVGRWVRAATVVPGPAAPPSAA
ncbi:methyltransferase type 12 [Fibrella aestuarina BUZ 2]|uniref:Methyltransferase type 12 n=1 Tax=Fibrella aestuarina BUZ 2 TaxID=1166018 RepID=I0KAK4_9BACT|nr:class I SAM-dependent methyltransferase [Fibrella aestuarina]CCH01157.1 methyltransferase type 12 [Fibrella aestuarina BUZ 2]